MRRILWAVAATLLVLPIVFVGMHPIVQAFLCPACRGFVEVSDGVFMEKNASKAGLDHTADLKAGRERVSAFWGPGRAGNPDLFFCITEPCRQTFGVHHAIAMSYGAAFAVFDLTRTDDTIFAHELAHIERRARLGTWASMNDQTPSWFDEGLAVLISRDARYLNFDNGKPSCVGEVGISSLPADAKTWRRMAGKDPSIYAQASCSVLGIIDGLNADQARTLVLNIAENGMAGTGQ